MSRRELFIECTGCPEELADDFINGYSSMDQAVDAYFTYRRQQEIIQNDERIAALTKNGEAIVPKFAPLTLLERKKDEIIEFSLKNLPEKAIRSESIVECHKSIEGCLITKRDSELVVFRKEQDGRISKMVFPSHPEPVEVPAESEDYGTYEDLVNNGFTNRGDDVCYQLE